METIVVDGHEKESASVYYPDNLYTYGLGPFIGIGILNPKIKKGYLGHFISHDKTSAKELIDLAFLEAKEAGDLEIALAGNMCLPREPVEFDCMDNYDKVLKSHIVYTVWIKDLLSDYGITNVQNRFHEEYQEGAYSILVDTMKLKIIVDYLE